MARFFYCSSNFGFFFWSRIKSLESVLDESPSLLNGVIPQDPFWIIIFGLDTCQGMTLVFGAVKEEIKNLPQRAVALGGLVG